MTSASAQRSSARRITRLPVLRTSTSGTALPSTHSAPATTNDSPRVGLGFGLRFGFGLGLGCEHDERRLVANECAQDLLGDRCQRFDRCTERVVELRVPADHRRLVVAFDDEVALGRLDLERLAGSTGSYDSNGSGEATASAGSGSYGSGWNGTNASSGSGSTSGSGDVKASAGSGSYGSCWYGTHASTGSGDSTVSALGWGEPLRWARVRRARVGTARTLRAARARRRARVT